MTFKLAFKVTVVKTNYVEEARKATIYMVVILVGIRILLPEY